jgi:hypothetical protein
LSKGHDGNLCLVLFGDKKTSCRSRPGDKYGDKDDFSHMPSNHPKIIENIHFLLRRIRGRIPSIGRIGRGRRDALF